MKQIRKMITLLLAAALIVSLSGCVGQERTVQQEKEALVRILDDLAANMHPGTSGSSLTSARLAAELITWAATAKMDKQEAVQIVMEWVQTQSPEIQAAFQEQIESVGAAYSRIVEDGASDLLEAAGVDKNLDLSAQIQEIVRAILASGGID